MPGEFDKAFERAFDEAARDIGFTPDFEQSWERVEKKLRRRRRSRNRLRTLPYIALSFVLGAVLFGVPSFSQAFAPFFQTLKTVPHGAVSIVFGTRSTGTTKPRTAAPPGVVDPATPSPSAAADGQDVPESGSAQIRFDTWEAAAKSAEFAAPVIGYIPDGYKLEQINGFEKPGADKVYSLVLLYSSDDGDDHYTITLRQIGNNEKIDSGYDGKNGTFETVDVHGADAYLFRTTDGVASLEFRYGRLYVSIAGSLDKEQILNVAQQIQ